MAEGILINPYLDILFATLTVNFPNDDGITASCNNSYLSLSPISSTDTSVIFSIPYKGTWTVVLTDGITTKTINVEIINEGQDVSIKMIYERMLIENGVEKQTFTKNNVNVYTEDGVLAVSAIADSGASRRFYYTAIDVTNYTSLRFSGWYSNFNGGYGYASQIRAGVQIGKSYNQTVTEYIFSSTTEGNYTIDVSGLSGVYYISIFAAGATTDTQSTKSVVAKIRNMWLE